MKKLLALILALAMVICLCACGGKEDPKPTEDQKEPAADVATEPVQEDPTEAPVVSDGLSMTTLLNAPESPAEDFDVVEYGNGDVVLELYLGDDEIVVIPESLGVTHIASYTFANDLPVKAIKLSNSVKVIEMGAFGLNNNLEYVACGSELQEIGNGAFQNCKNLKEILLSEALVKIGVGTFSGCASLSSVELPASTTDIHPKTFGGCADNFTIIGESGSVAEEYASSEGIAFQAK